MKFDNSPFDQGADGRLRLSDVVGDIVNQTAKIYLTADENTKLLSDCLCPFNGRVRSIDGYDDKWITITLEDNGYIMDTLLLTKQVVDFETMDSE